MLDVVADCVCQLSSHFPTISPCLNVASRRQKVLQGCAKLGFNMASRRQKVLQGCARLGLNEASKRQRAPLNLDARWAAGQTMQSNAG